MSIHTPTCDLLEIEVPVFLAGMGGVAYAEVCAAVTEAGGFGTLGMAGAEPDEIRREMRAVRERTDGPFGVDMLAALPEELEAAIGVIIDEGATAFISGLGVPGPVIERCHAAGLKVLSMCGRVGHAVAAAEAGCDAVIAQGTEAGGHTGRVAGMALVPQIVDAVDVPVVAAGSIVDGRGLAAALALGAQGVWMGTRFIASHEARAAKEYKDAIARADSDATTVTRCYTGKPLRALRNPYSDDWDRRPDEIQPWPLQFATSEEERVLIISSDEWEDVDPARSCLPAGQGCGSIGEALPASEIVRSVVREAESVISGMGGLCSDAAGS
jgi:enoyl-[acyl-carrier protein] reductase II